MTKPILSFEFFPPKTEEGMDKLRAARKQLAQLQPEFFSVTFGAGGTTRDRTLETVLEIQREGFSAAPHLSCVGATRDSLKSLLDEYRSHGIKRIVALRGDIPSGMIDPGEFRYAADLVAFIRQEYGDIFQLEVAAYPETHPEASSATADLASFKRKVDAGADGAITQYFYNADAYFNFMDECGALGIDIPVVPGIMPINNYSQLARFSDACGAEIPRWMRKKLESYGNDMPSIHAFGLDVVTALCDRLLQNGAPGLHFYTMNQAGLVSTVCQRLGL
ncbi:MAG: methylenetetrahydrofolate reductase [NAD(P)H] [Burkholderiales bacterium]